MNYVRRPDLWNQRPVKVGNSKTDVREPKRLQIARTGGKMADQSANGSVSRALIGYRGLMTSH